MNEPAQINVDNSDGANVKVVAVFIVLAFFLGFGACWSLHKLRMQQQEVSVREAVMEFEAGLEARPESLLEQSDEKMITLSYHQNLLDSAIDAVNQRWEKTLAQVKKPPPIPEGLLTFDECKQAHVFRDEAEYRLWFETRKKEWGLE